MRDLTESMFRFSWAMSMFGVREMTRLVSPGGRPGDSASSLDVLSQTAEDQLEGVAYDVYRAGGELQEGMVNAVDSLARVGFSNPVQGLSRAMKDTWEALDKSWAHLQGMGGERKG